ncbi:MAG: hypothetical protein ACP5N3_06100 [Candidatus Nanoarchaeia archaeon]
MDFKNEPGQIVTFYTKLAQLRVYNLVVSEISHAGAKTRVSEQARNDVARIISDYSGNVPKLEQEILKSVANEYGVELPEVKTYTAEQLEILDKKLDELTDGPGDISLMLRTINVFKKKDILYLGDVKNREPQELLGLRGVGKIVITQFENIFKMYGLSWNEKINYIRPEDRNQAQK